MYFIFLAVSYHITFNSTCTYSFSNHVQNNICPTLRPSPCISYQRIHSNYNMGARKPCILKERGIRYTLSINSACMYARCSMDDAILNIYTVRGDLRFDINNRIFYKIHTKVSLLFQFLVQYLLTLNHIYAQPSLSTSRHLFTPKVSDTEIHPRCNK